MSPSCSQIKTHLAAQYAAWERIIYPHPRSTPPAKLEVRFAEGTSGYDKRLDVIVIYTPDGNIEDYAARMGNTLTVPDRHRLCVNEIELLHEMMHEYQYKAAPATTPDGMALFQRYARTFGGPGHDETFFTSIAHSARRLNVAGEELVRNL